MQQNIFIKVKSEDKEKMLTHYSSNLSVQIIENYAQVKVYAKEKNKPLSKVQ